MHFPRMSRELFMLPASFNLSPNVLVLLHLSEPARSHRENLIMIIEKKCLNYNLN